VVTVSDDGAGFDPARTRPGGLVTMRERAALMDATLEVRSRTGRGTEVRVSVPISDQQRESRPELVAPAMRRVAARRKRPVVSSSR
jgi:signal transduction histidine kinase